jgi:twinkle protein
MQLIPDTIDLSEYSTAPQFQAQVRPAADFASEVKAEFSPHQKGRNRAPSMLSAKAQGRIEFRPGEITCWSGYNGHRKSMFTSQVALDLCVQKQRVLIVSLEMSPARTMARMTRQAMGTGQPSDHNIDRFHQWTQNRLWIFDHVGMIDGKTMQGLCRYFAQELQGQHVFIDSMMMVCASEEHLDEQKQFVTTLCRIAQETGLHLHLVTHCRKPASGDEAKPPTKYDIKGTGSISDQAHNVIMVWANKAKKTQMEANPHDFDIGDQPDAMISIEKQRNGDWEGKLKFWFHPGALRFCDDRSSAVEEYVLSDQLPTDENGSHLLGKRATDWAAS